MTISYNLDIATLSFSGFWKILFRWKGSIWKSTFGEFILWVILYFTISIIYRFLIYEDWQRYYKDLYIGKSSPKIVKSCKVDFGIGNLTWRQLRTST
jgi:hypothetical protein